MTGKQESGDKPQLHQSQLSMYANCGLAYYFRYVEGRRLAPGIAAITGTATHKSIESNLAHKIDTGELLPLEQVTEIARDAVHHAWEAEGVMLDDEEKGQGEDKLRGSVVDTAVKLARLHHQQLAPTIEPVAVEKKFKLELPMLPVDLVGTIDVEEADGLRDHKCFKRSPSQLEVDRSLQLTLYSLAKRTIDGREPRRISLDVLLKRKRGPKITTISTTRTVEDYHRLLDRISRITTAIDKGDFIPSNPDNWRCSPRWCGYFGLCPQGRGRLSISI
jgi:hypothetical protein